MTHTARVNGPVQDLAGRGGTGTSQLNDAPLPQRFSRYIAGLRENPPGRMLRYPDLSAQPWWNAQQFSLCRDLESMSGTISEEFYRLTSDHFQEERESIPRAGDWNVSFLFEAGGFKNQRNTDACPVTTSIIEAHRTMRGLGGLCYFSCLGPTTTVAPHRGATNMRLRCHLGIEVPADCGIKVGGVQRTWAAARSIVFDDSFEHEAWNSSSRRRVVLIIDFWHPDLSDDEVRLITGFHRHAVDAGLGTLRYRQRTVLDQQR
jgi:Aspartyl/Asparaginyl beta-hydroxylase